MLNNYWTQLQICFKKRVKSVANQDQGQDLVSETESEDEEPTEYDLEFLDDQDADTDTDGEWVC